MDCGALVIIVMMHSAALSETLHVETSSMEMENLCIHSGVDTKVAHRGLT